ncbi:MAG: NMD3 family protein [Promethearchaeota archaeon]|nr:MAG: NMD3 family protein [Candidatus Lokiarchaeota archaeon]
MSRFCAICGKSINEKAPHFGMCLQCYIKEHPLFELDEKLSINVCLNCMKFSKKQNWLEPEIDDIEHLVIQAIRLFLLDPKFKDQQIEFQIEIDSSSLQFTSKNLLQALTVIIWGIHCTNPKIRHSQEVNVHIIYEICDNCQKLMSGEFFTSIIQIRVKDETHFDFIKQVLKEVHQYVESLFEKDPKHYISKIVDQKYGVDLYLSSNELMNYIISYLRGKYSFLQKNSKKLVGRDNQRGKNIYRLKTLVKFLPFRKNDILLIQNEKYRVDAIFKNKVVLKKTNGEKITKYFNYFFDQPYEIIHGVKG